MTCLECMRPCVGSYWFIFIRCLMQLIVLTSKQKSLHVHCQCDTSFLEGSFLTGMCTVPCTTGFSMNTAWGWWQGNNDFACWVMHFPCSPTCWWLKLRSQNAFWWWLIYLFISDLYDLPYPSYPRDASVSPPDIDNWNLVIKCPNEKVINICSRCSWAFLPRHLG